jgi:putative ABC transport system permease protein
MTRLMASQIWGVSTTDPWTFSAVAAVILAAGLTACLFPARRATEVDPLISLRYEYLSFTRFRQTLEGRRIY